MLSMPYEYIHEQHTSIISLTFNLQPPPLLSFSHNCSLEFENFVAVYRSCTIYLQSSGIMTLQHCDFNLLILVYVYCLLNKYITIFYL